MKLEILLSRIATFGVLAATIGLATDALALAMFATTAGTFVFLIAASDYSRRPGQSCALVKVSRRRAALPLAA